MDKVRPESQSEHTPVSSTRLLLRSWMMLTSMTTLQKGLTKPTSPCDGVTRQLSGRTLVKAQPKRSNRVALYAAQDVSHRERSSADGVDGGIYRRILVWHPAFSFLLTSVDDHPTASARTGKSDRNRGNRSVFMTGCCRASAQFPASKQSFSRCEALLIPELFTTSASANNRIDGDDHRPSNPSALIGGFRRPWFHAI
jgi:hypothetical protein